MLFVNEKKKERLKEEILDLKEEIGSLEDKINDLKDEEDNLNQIIEKKNKEVKKINNDINDLKTEYEETKHSLKFLKNIKQSPKNIKDYVNISLSKIEEKFNYFHSGNVESAYLYIYLNVKNLSIYPILSMNFEITIEDLLGNILIDHFPFESYSKIMPNESCNCVDNSQIRDTSYYKSRNYFVRPANIEDIIEENDYLEKLILKVNKIKIVVLIDGENKTIDIKL